ncbi:MAG: hypothetical protein AABW81_02950 [Nanoarchaeota archaeon]
MKKPRTLFSLAFIFSLGMISFDKVERLVYSYYNSATYVCWNYTIPDTIEGFPISVKVCDMNADNNPDSIEYYLEQPLGISKKIITCSKKDIHKPITIKDCLIDRDFQEYLYKKERKETEGINKWVI